MSNPPLYPVFFDCEALNDEQTKKLQSYFQIKRKSGGGECSSAANVSGKVYRIDFKDQEAQQRVLKKREHLLEIADVSLVLSVRDSPGSADSSSSSASVSSSKHEPPASPQTPSSPASSLPPSGKEYEVNLELYLLQYLRDCPKAGDELDKELQSLKSSARLAPEKAQVSVRSLVQFNDLEEAKTWETKVETLFENFKDRYYCHFEVDARQIALLFEDCNVCQTSDDVKVYPEAKMAVVVGEHSQVKARLQHVADSHVKGRSQSLSRKHSVVRRLGEAKLRLLWEELKRSLLRNFPEATVTRGEDGQLILDGPVEEISKASDMISEKGDMVKERTVSDIGPHLLAFLKRVYNTPEKLRDVLGCGENVEIELRATEMRLFSLSDHKIEQTLKEIKDQFKEETIEVPNCFEVSAELHEALKAKVKKINDKGSRVQVSFSKNAVCTLGHAKEVNEIQEVVTEFILEQLNIEDRVIVPFPELAQQLSKLLQLNGFDFSGVNLYPSKSSSSVALKGPSIAVTQVRTRLRQFLESVVKESITIDVPGALRYFKSLSGSEKLSSVGHSHKCLVQLEDQTAASSLGGYDEEIVARYCLNKGLQVLVCLGDITKQEADALVNAANEDLKHAGGVAQALSNAGGPEVQEESTALVKNIGKVSTGDVVVTTSGKLQCKKLLHAVGPKKHKAGGREKILLEKTVKSALTIAETMEFKSIALPCISSGVFGVPVHVCTEAIVSAVRAFGNVGGRSLNKITLIDNRREVVKSLKDACDRLLRDISSGNSGSTDGAGGLEYAGAAAAGGSGVSVRVETIQGTIETQQVDCLVCPMFGHEPLSTRVGYTLSNVVGPALTTTFNQVAGGATLPGATVLVEGLPGLQSNAVMFLNLISWNKNQPKPAKQALEQGISSALLVCESKGFRSVAFPVMGPGAVLQFPHNVASQVLLKTIHAFEQNRAGRTPFLIRIVIHPNDKDSSKAFQNAQQTVHLRGFTNDADPNYASFYRHVSVTNHEVTALMGSVKLQIVHGDIIHEKTDVIVNSTGFQREHSGVSKAILTAAGPTVQAELRKAGEPEDYMCTTDAGLLGCKEIIHSSFKHEPQAMSKTCKKILKLCQSKGYTSVAFPAINTGLGAMDHSTACRAMLDGMAAAITDLSPNSLNLIRIVILQQPIFTAFRSELENRFGQIAPQQNLIGKLKNLMTKSKSSGFSVTHNIALTKLEPAVISAISCSSDNVKALKRVLEAVLQQQLVERDFDQQDLSRLDEMEVAAVRAKARALGVSMEHSVRASAGNTTKSVTRGRADSGEKIIVLKGLKEDVLLVAELVNKAVQKALTEDLQVHQEELLAECVQWFIENQQREWQHFSTHQNYILEEAHKRKQVFVKVEAVNGTKVKVNLTALEATDGQTGKTYKVKRCEADTAIELPDYWTPMAGESFKKVEVDPNTKEFQEIAQGFNKTARYKIKKIERVQNYYLWRRYSVMRQQMLAKNGAAELGEKYLYHGTSAESCNCIEMDRFDRSFAGKHAAAFGKGVYFAVQAEYSARSFSPADSSGLKRLYVARVLTGRYTVGQPSMVAPPPRGTDPTDRYDSLVNKQLNPYMFVIFHDDQAYPEYLITFN